MILLCWMLQQHRIWRGCKLRVFSMTTNAGKEQAEEAGNALTEMLRQRKMGDVEVRVIIAEDEEMLEPFNCEVSLPPSVEASEAGDVTAEAPVGTDDNAPIETETHESDAVAAEKGEVDASKVARPSAASRIISAAHETTASLDCEAVKRLNNVIHSHSQDAQLVVVNLPENMGHSNCAEAQSFMTYCDSLTHGLDKVLFVKSSGHEIFQLQKH